MDAPTRTGRRFAERGDHAFEILDHDILPVESVGGSVRIAMTSRVEGDGVVTRGAQYFAGAFPGMAGLAAAVLKVYEGAVRVASGIAGYSDPADAVSEVHRFGCSGESCACAHCCILLSVSWFTRGVGQRLHVAKLYLAEVITCILRLL